MGFLAALGGQVVGIAGLAWVRLVFCLLVCFGCAFGGWHFRGLKADAEIAALNAKADREREDRQKAYDKAVADAEAQGRVVDAKHAKEVQAISDQTDKLKQEIVREKYKNLNAGIASTQLGTFWVQHYNAALRTPSGQAAASGVAAGSPKGADLADAADGAIDQWDALYVHTENAKRWAECRSELNALIDFETQGSAPGATQ